MTIQDMQAETRNLISNYECLLISGIYLLHKIVEIIRIWLLNDSESNKNYYKKGY